MGARGQANLGRLRAWGALQRVHLLTGPVGTFMAGNGCSVSCAHWFSNGMYVLLCFPTVVCVCVCAGTLLARPAQPNSPCPNPAATHHWLPLAAGLVPGLVLPGFVPRTTEQTTARLHTHTQQKALAKAAGTARRIVAARLHRGGQQADSTPPTKHNVPCAAGCRSWAPPPAPLVPRAATTGRAVQQPQQQALPGSHGRRGRARTPPPCRLPPPQAPLTALQSPQCVPRCARRTAAAGWWRQPVAAARKLQSGARAGGRAAWPLQQAPWAGTGQQAGHAARAAAAPPPRLRRRRRRRACVPQRAACLRVRPASCARCPLRTAPLAAPHTLVRAARTRSPTGLPRTAVVGILGGGQLGRMMALAAVRRRGAGRVRGALQRRAGPAGAGVPASVPRALPAYTRTRTHMHAAQHRTAPRPAGQPGRARQVAGPRARCARLVGGKARAGPLPRRKRHQGLCDAGACVRVRVCIVRVMCIVSCVHPPRAATAAAAAMRAGGHLRADHRD